jgi:hypothetical protein
MLVVLNAIEQELAKSVAGRRYAMNRNTNTVDRKIGKQSVEETDLEGIGGEIAFCRAYNLYPDTNLDSRPHFDAVLSNGTTVDVKTTKYLNGKLIAIRGKVSKPPDAYALVVGTFPNYRIAGLMRASELLQDSRLINLGYGLTFAAEQSELESFEQFTQGKYYRNLLDESIREKQASERSGK